MVVEPGFARLACGREEVRWEGEQVSKMNLFDRGKGGGDFGVVVVVVMVVVVEEEHGCIGFYGDDSMCCCDVMFGMFGD